MPETRHTVLALMAHPDDAEILCGGTLLRLRDAGWTVVTATMTPGDCGSATLPPSEIAAVRREEAAAAAARLGGAYHCLEQRDGLVVYGEEAIRAAVALLRRVRPTLVVAHSPADYMLDHEEASRIARHACFCAPIPNFAGAADDPAAPLDAVPHLYYADPIEGVGPLGEPIDPDLRIDISAVIDEKAALLAEHASQREWLRSHHGVDEYLDSMKAWSARRGAEAGVAYAEGFRRHRGHAYPHTDMLGETLGEAG